MSDCPLAAAIEKHKITVSSVFVPLSRSRHAGKVDHNKRPIVCLNWIVTLAANGRAIIETDYMAGRGHCPSDNKKAPAGWNRPARMFSDCVTDWECEHGFEAAITMNGDHFAKKKRYVGQQESGRSAYVFYPIVPDPRNVVACLLLDSDVLNYTGFADWAESMGFNSDSIREREIYNLCLGTALKMRAGLGEAALSELTTAAQDY